MELTVYNWCGSTSTISPYEHNIPFEGTEADMFRIVKEFLDRKLNVMILRNDEGFVICVDTRSFSCR